MKIDNQADLNLLAATLHDARFTADAINYDPAGRVFNLKCWVREPREKQFNGSVLAQFAQDKADSTLRSKRPGGFKAFVSAVRRRFTKEAVTDDSRSWKACQLSFAKVADSKVNTKEKVGYYELATIRFSERERKLELVTQYGIEIALTIGELDGTLMETDEKREWR